MSTLAFCACYVHGTNILLVVSTIHRVDNYKPAGRPCGTSGKSSISVN